MKISKENVEKIAQLARIQLSNEEKEKYSSELSAILEYVDQLQDLKNLEGKEAMSVQHNMDELREDEQDGGRLQTQILKQAPDSEDGFIVVPAVFEE